MIPAAFTYHAPRTLRDAVRLLRAYEGDARVVSGGMSLIPAMKLRLVQPEHLVDIGRLGELDYVRRTEDGGVAIGAGATYRSIEKSRAAAAVAPMLVETVRQVGDIQVRNRGTLCGSAAHADPAADAPATLLALDATFHTTGGASRRAIQARRFFVDAYETVLGPTEVLTEIRIPKQPSRTGSTYLKFANKASRFAIVGVAAAVTVDRKGVCTRARIAVTGAGPCAVRATASERYLVGREVTPEAIAAAAARASRGMEFIEDIHGSEEYREHLTRVITQRALAEAVGRVGA